MSEWVLSVLGAGDFVIRGSSQTLGRDDTSDISLGELQTSVSRRHARLEPATDGIWVTDLGSTNGTRINGDTITSRTLAREGNTVEFGRVHCIIRRTTGRGAVTASFSPRRQFSMPPTRYPQPAPAPPVSYVVAGPTYVVQPERISGTLSTVGMTLGIVVACFMVIALFPCLGWMNWFTLLFGGVANILNWVAVFTEGRYPPARNRAIIGLVMTFGALFIGGIRLTLGGGCV